MGKSPLYKDRVKLYISAGNGGDGMSSFRREKFVPYGGPSGGDGGNGADVYLVGNTQSNSLLDLYYRPHHKAEHGVKGGTKDCHGRNGYDLEIPVPCGTVVMNEETGKVIGEILEDGQRMRIAKGGKGGLGNKRFTTSTNQAPTESTPGTLGEQITIWLTLKTIAEVGLVGYPNAGKSTILTGISGAHPKIGAYPFTTLNPIIGTVEFVTWEKLRIADIPGLIDGAHEGTGLGHDFLRHIERTKFLVFVIDMGGCDGRDPTEDYLNLREELKLYLEELDERPYIVVANKMDVPESELFLEEFREKTGEDPLLMTAALEEGIPELKQMLYDAILKKKDPPAQPEDDVTESA